MVILLVLPISEAARTAEVLLGPYTGEEHSRRHLVVRDRRLNRAYNASVNLPKRVDPDAGKKKRSRVPEVELGGPIAVKPLCAVRLSDGGGSSRNLEAAEEKPAKKVVQDPFVVHAEVSSRGSSNNGVASHVEVVETTAAGRTVSQVDKAIGTIRYPRLDGTESSSGGLRARGDGGNLEIPGDAATTPELNVGE